ncbi:MAG: excinuclease ABC subunit UvrC [Candidatus Marinamargulisbacteria bacterium]
MTDHNTSSITSRIKELPSLPGVYQMLDSFGAIIYVGKAKNIKKRVASYFTGNRNYKTQLLVRQIHTIEPIITKTEHDALLLENNLIKQYQPKFNILLKDDKTYPYIKITLNEPFPRIIVTRKKTNDGAKYFGPYTSYGSTRKLKQALYTLFPIRDCKQPIDLIKHQPKCLQLDIGKCIGPCIYKDTKSAYDRLIQACIQFLDGRNNELIVHLSEKMTHYAKQKAYEKAADIRDKITLLTGLQDQQRVDIDTDQHYFFIGFSSNAHYHYGVCQHYSKKRFISQNGKYAPISIPFHDFFGTFIDSLLTSAPQKINVVINKTHTIDPLILSSHPTQNIHIIQPTKGRYMERLSITELNAQKSLIGVSKNTIRPILTCPLQTLKKDLGLTSAPVIIFGCDISHYYGTRIVSSVVVFIDGKPAKSYYRHFNIKTVTDGKSNDVKSMHETVLRLIDHFDKKPNLLLIDGGKGQLNAALSALKAKHITGIECVGLAKKNEEIYTPWSTAPICLPYHHRGLNLLRFVRDEAHRFALNFQRKKRRIQD